MNVYLMKAVIVNLSLLLISSSSYAQTVVLPRDTQIKFDSLNNYLKETTNFIGGLNTNRGKLSSIEVSKNPIPFILKQTVLKNPFGNSYPLDYSVVYKKSLIALFEPGIFVCYKLSGLDRDLIFEGKINKKRFQYHWVIGDRLVGLSNGIYYYLDGNDDWTNYSENVPFANQPKLYDDKEYLAFCDCNGEFGGTVYFYNRQSKKTYFTQATCANSVMKRNGKYIVLSSLGHGFGSNSLKEINIPDSLQIIDKNQINNLYKHFALGHSDSMRNINTIYDFYGFQIFSSFIYLNEPLYLIHWYDKTFLAKIDNKVIEIVNPLFNSSMYTHNPITNNYDGTILINMDFYGTAKEKEVSCIIINNNQFTKIDWNEKQNH